MGAKRLCSGPCSGHRRIIRLSRIRLSRQAPCNPSAVNKITVAPQGGGLGSGRNRSGSIGNPSRATFASESCRRSVLEDEREKIM